MIIIALGNGIMFKAGNGGGSTSNWILADTTWNDSKEWIDTETWND